MAVFVPGLRLGERYVLEERIGAGGMSHVWRALDEVLARAVAVKTLDAQLVDDPALRAAIRMALRKTIPVSQCETLVSRSAKFQECVKVA